jgi:hypothetical protein
VGSDYRSRLEAAVRTVLDVASWPGELVSAVQSMATLCAEISGIDPDGGDDAETVLDHGTALSPRDAARCLLDMARTTRFVRGVVAGIELARQRFPGRVIEVVYAGCGPWAALVVPACLKYPPDQVRFTLLDAHRRSLEAARTLVDGLGLGDHVRDCVHGDATTYRHPGPLHMVLTEAMQRALAKEPQLAITANLAPQLAAGGLYLPERITVDLALADLGREFSLCDPSTPGPIAERDRVPLGRLLDASTATIGVLMASVDADGALPPTVVRVPDLDRGSTYSVILRTRVTVLGDVVLEDYDSGLTVPVVLHELGAVRGGETFELRYHLGPDPGFRIGAVR